MAKINEKKLALCLKLVYIMVVDSNGNETGLNDQEDKMKQFIVEYRITNKDQSIDKDCIEKFIVLSEAKKFLVDGLNKWDGNGNGIGSGQIKEVILTPDDDLPFPMYANEELVATYTPLKNNEWYIDKV